MADPGTHADVESSGGWLIAFLRVTAGGMLIIALMTIASGVSAGPGARKQGKSRVVESGLSLILGWRRARARFGIHKT